MPWVQGKQMSAKLSGYMNIVSFMDVNSKGARVLHTSSTDRYYAKDQFDAIEGGKLVNPTMPKLLAAIEEKRGAATNPTTKRRATPARKRTGKQ
jgi:hypothetical protein